MHMYAQRQQRTLQPVERLRHAQPLQDDQDDGGLGRLLEHALWCEREAARQQARLLQRTRIRSTDLPLRGAVQAVRHAPRARKRLLRLLRDE
jgi:hypothetical protein